MKMNSKIIFAVIAAMILISGVTWRIGYHQGVKKHESAPLSGGKLLFYRNPMNPAITSPTPAKDEMGMDYIPVYADDARAQTKSHEQQAEDFFRDDATPSRLGVVTMTEQGIRLSGVQVAEAVNEKIERSIRTFGIVVPDETLVNRVQTKTAGWVEKIFISSGQHVKKGSPILAVYSPEFLSSQEEFIKAMELASGNSAENDGQNFGQTLRNSAKRRLELLDVPPYFIRELERNKKLQRAVTLISPADGFITAKDIFTGQEVRPGMELFTVTDLSVVWVNADLYEYEAKSVHPGQEGILTTTFDPSLRLAGRVDYVYPYVNSESRTLKVRFTFNNKDLLLKPGMYVDVNLRFDYPESVVIPDSAVMDSGIRKIVFVEKTEGRFEPREVKTGVRSDGKAQILSGVNAHERVVVRANFLLDSESRLRAVIEAAMASGVKQ